MATILIALVLSCGGLGGGVPHNAAAAGIHPVPHHVAVSWWKDRTTHNTHVVVIQPQRHCVPVVWSR